MYRYFRKELSCETSIDISHALLNSGKQMATSSKKFRYLLNYTSKYSNSSKTADRLPNAKAKTSVPGGAHKTL